MFTKLFPYHLHLQIFQLDEYSPANLLSWIFSHYFTRTIENKKPLIWTKKVKIIYSLAILFAIILLLALTVIFRFWGLIAGLLLATQSYFFLLLAYYVLLPVEMSQKNKIKQETQRKIASFANLKIIGVTGSYGKTSVKEFLYQILRTEHTVLKTPESYNTPYGIAKVVDLELDESYEYFICEMGAYRVGEIKEICDMVHPQYGILTGINEQHLETFGSIENTVKGKFELIDALPKDGIGIVNIQSEPVRKEYPNHNKNNNIFLYGYRSEVYSFNDEGTHFDLRLDDEKHHAKTKLLGFANIQNIIAAATMAHKLGMKPQIIIKAIENLKSVPHRMEFKSQDTMTIIDDAYNSNYDGFKNAIEVLGAYQFPHPNPKILVTPGIVDLGNKTLRIHEDLGNWISKISTIDYVILIGKSDRTKGLKEGIMDKKKIIEVTSLNEAWKKIGELKLKRPVVLLENDLPDNY